MVQSKMSNYYGTLFKNILIGLICLNASASDNIIRISGSSTAYPFITTIAQMFSLTHNKDNIIVESTGTGNGLQLFCSGSDNHYPDLASASRAIKPSEVALCNSHKINNILEINYGYDGIIIANAQMDSNINISRKELFLALADTIPIKGKLIKNPYQKWSDVNPSLPDVSIELYGPASTSGTRDEFDQIVMENSCGNFPEYARAKRKCPNIRTDGKYIEIGNNENLIIQKLKKNKDAWGVIGYNFFRNNLEDLKSVTIDGVTPSPNNIREGSYALSRPLLLYAKADNQNKLAEPVKIFLQTATSENTVGENGYLANKGLIPLQDKDLKEVQKIISAH